MLRELKTVATIRTAAKNYAAIARRHMDTPATRSRTRNSTDSLTVSTSETPHPPSQVVSRHGNAVILSKEDYDAMTETAYLLRSPANAERLLTAIERARRGEFEQHDLFDA